MKKKSILMLSILALTSLPYCGYADNDVQIINNTDYFGTLSLGFSPCSSNLGDKGVIKPHETHVFSHSYLMFCGNNCDVKVFNSKNCSGKEIAVIGFSAKNGVLNVNNMDKEHIVISGNGFDITVDPAKPNILSWFKKIFS